MSRSLIAVALTLVGIVTLASCAPAAELTARPLPTVGPTPTEVPLIEIELPDSAGLDHPDAETLPVEAAAARWVADTTDATVGLTIDQVMLDCAVSATVQLLGPDRTVVLVDSPPSDEEIPLLGEVLSACGAHLEGAGRRYADANGLVLSAPTLDCLDGAFADPVVARAGVTALLWELERGVEAIPDETEQVGVQAVVACLNDDELARLTG